MIKTLITNIEEQLNRMESRIEHIAEQTNLVNQHHHDLYGNGKKGLIQRLEELETKINNHNKLYIYLIAVITVITFLPKVKEFLILMK